LRLAHDAYQRALALGDSTAEAHAALGWMKMQFEWDWPGAEEELAQALALNPNSVYALSLAAVLASIQGRLAESNELWLRLVGMDPLSSVLYNNAAIGLYYEGRLDEAQALVRTMLEISSEREGSHALMGGFLLAQGRKDEALEEYLREPSEENRLWGLTEAYYALGRKADSDTALTSYIDKYHETRPFSIACLHAYRGERDPAFEWLDRAFASRARELAWIKVEPDLRGLRGDPRWQHLLQKMRLAG